MAIMILKTMMVIAIITSRNIMLFAEYGEALFLRIAGEGTRNTTFGKYCNISEEIFTQARLWGVGALTRDWVPNSAPITTRHLSESSL